MAAPAPPTGPGSTVGPVARAVARPAGLPLASVLGHVVRGAVRYRSRTSPWCQNLSARTRSPLSVGLGGLCGFTVRPNVRVGPGAGQGDFRGLGTHRSMLCAVSA